VNYKRLTGVKTRNNSAPKKAALLGGKAKRRGSGGGIFAFPPFFPLDLHGVLSRAARGSRAGGAAKSVRILQNFHGG